jgi:site-specific DNA-methyltransferase (adenine-specific)
MTEIIKIDPEFKSLIPPLAPEELAQLEANIIADGCRDALVVWNGLLLDGHNRFEICNRNNKCFTAIPAPDYIKDREAAKDWIDKTQLGRRNITPDTFALLLGRRYNRMRKPEGAPVGNKNASNKQLGQNDPVVSTAAKLAKEHGVSEATVKRAGKFADEVDAEPELQDAIMRRNPVSKAKKKIKIERHKRDLSEAQKHIDTARKQKIESVCDLRVCSCVELFKSGIKPDAVITDPPYPYEFLPVFTELAEGCKEAGVPLVAVMSGQSYLPEVMRRLSEHLRYRWTLAYMTPGGQAVQQWKAKVNTSWKPVILFGDSTEWFGDVAISKPNDNDKRFHGWGQSESGMADLVERLTKPGQLICDPFLGGGTTAVVALALGRRFVGCDIDSAHVEQTKARVMHE